MHMLVMSRHLDHIPAAIWDVRGWRLLVIPSSAPAARNPPVSKRALTGALSRLSVISPARDAPLTLSRVVFAARKKARVRRVAAPRV